MQRPIMLGILATSVALAHAEIITIDDVVLDGFQTIPATNSPAIGHAIVSVDTDTRDILINGTFSGMLGTVFGGHIHGPADADQNSPIVIFALDIVSQDGHSGSFSLDARLTQFQLSAFLDSRTYLNLHSTEFRDGEIRGQIVVPAPSVAALLPLGGLMLTRRRRKSV